MGVCRYGEAQGFRDVVCVALGYGSRGPEW